jgi:hypothetical protein
VSAVREYPVCPHDRETWERETALYSSRCPECKARVCYDCRRHGWTDAMIPLVSWMSGTCDDCYRERGRRAKIREDLERERSSRVTRARCWGEGFNAATTGASNPYEEPTYREQCLLEQNDWLREEATSWPAP